MTFRVSPDWHQSYFGAEWLRIATGVTAPDAEREMDFAVSALGLRPGDSVVDAPCGHGRHSVTLARRGFRVTGVDSSPESIELAVRNAQDAGCAELTRFTVADMRTVALDDLADAVLIMQTSFGFMATRHEDQRVLENMAGLLRSGGQLVLDVVNVFRVARTMIVPRRWERLADGTVHIEDRDYDFRTGRRNVKVELFTTDGRHLEMSHSIRLYALHELDEMLTAAGLRITATYGGYDGAPLGFETKRLIVVAELTG